MIISDHRHRHERYQYNIYITITICYLDLLLNVTVHYYNDSVIELLLSQFTKLF